MATGAIPARSPARSVNSKPGNANSVASARSTRQPGRAWPGSFPAAEVACAMPSRLPSVASISGSAPIGRITSATRRVLDWQANWLNATTLALPSAFNAACWSAKSSPGSSP